MSQFSKDRELVRELARQLMEIAVSDRHVRMRARFKANNDLRVVRPPLIMEEIPWHEMDIDGELTCLCQDERLRQMEYRLRIELYREKYFRCDNYIEPVWTVSKSFSSSGNGFEIDENRLAIDKSNSIVSHKYKDVLEDEESLEKYHDPVICANPEIDKENVAFANDILGDIMPVRLRGHGIYYPPWDIIATLRGVQPILMDMYDRPEYLHKIISLFTRGMAREMDQMEALGLYDSNNISLHCTPAAVTLPQGAKENKCSGIWFRTMAQMFSTISPDAHYEFDIQYSVPLASRCAYTYYGCCEPLSDRIDKLKHYPNLRKIGVSPWSDVEKSAEAIGNKYVLSRKPNPALVAVSTDPEQVKREISETARLCRKYNCPCDITLKDISTVSYKPQNLIIWAKAASEALDEYYGRDE